MNNIHRLIKNDYYEQRLKNSYILEQRKEEIYKKFNEFKKIDEEIKQLSFDASKAVLFKSKSENLVIQRLEEKISALKEEKKRILIKNGYSKDYLSNIYTCSLCRDTGYITNNNQTKRCSCYNKKIIEILFEKSNMDIVEYENFNTFDETLFSEETNEEKYGIKKSPRKNILYIKKTCEEFIRNFNLTNEKNLFFSGPAGTGKTFMASCIAKELINRGKPVVYFSSPVLFDMLQKKYSNESSVLVSYDEASDLIYNCSLLIIDDLGTEGKTAFRYSELLNILNKRYLNNLKYPCKTIISTNISPKELYDFYSERIASRILGGFSFFKFGGDDIRILKRSAGK